MTPSIMTLSIMAFSMINKTWQSARRHSAEHCYAGCRLYWLSFMLSVTYKPFKLCVTYKRFMLSITYKPFMLSAIMLNVVMLSVMAPKNSWYSRRSAWEVCDTHCNLTLLCQGALCRYPKCRLAGCRGARWTFYKNLCAKKRWGVLKWKKLTQKVMICLVLWHPFPSYGCFGNWWIFIRTSKSRCTAQGRLTEGEGSVQLTSSLR